jgi:hypothetical protein
LYYTLSEGSNYLGASVAELGAFTIAKAAPAQANFTYTKSVPYNAQPQSAVVTPIGSGLGETLTLYYDGELTPPTNAGTYNLTYTLSEGLNYRGVSVAEPLGTFTIARGNATTLLAPPDSIRARLGYPLSAASLPVGWHFSAADSVATYALADIGKPAWVTIQFQADDLQKANYDWAGVQNTNATRPLKVSLLPDSAWLQLASIANQTAVISVRAGTWQHLNWSSRVFGDSLSVVLAPASDGNYQVTVKGKPGGPYEHVNISATVGADGRVPVVPPVLGAGRHTGLPIQRVFDVRGNYVGQSLSEVERPGVYIVRQGSQTRRIVVR